MDEALKEIKIHKVPMTDGWDMMWRSKLFNFLFKKRDDVFTAVRDIAPPI